MIGTHSGSYAVYRALAVAAGALDRGAAPDLTDTAPTDRVGPHPQWFDPDRIVSLDPFGAVVAEVFAEYLAQGYDIRPTIAITKAHIDVPEIDRARRGRPPARRRRRSCATRAPRVVTKAAHRAGVVPAGRRQALRLLGGRAAPHAVRGDAAACSPSWSRAATSRCSCRRSAGQTVVHVRRRSAQLADPPVPLTARVHDECNGSDVFGSDICTCRPYLAHAHRGVHPRRPGRRRRASSSTSARRAAALGEVTKFLVYNARKRQAGGDRAEQYFARTECVAGVQDMRFQELMPDVLHWLGVTQHPPARLDEQHEARRHRGVGHQVGERVPIPDELIPADARVEMDAKLRRRLLHRRRRPRRRRARQRQGPRLRVTTARAGPRRADSARSRICARPRPSASARRAVWPVGARRRARSTSPSTVARLAPTPPISWPSITRARYPDLAVPLHSRWRHFDAGGVRPRRRSSSAALGAATAGERARARIDLVVVSVLLDAGAGPRWRYTRRRRRARIGRSEGLAVASFRLFAAGVFSADPARPVARRRRRRSRALDGRAARARAPGRRPATRWSGSTAAPRCCAGSARRCAGARAVRRTRRAGRPARRPARAAAERRAGGGRRCSARSSTARPHLAGPAEPRRRDLGRRLAAPGAGGARARRRPRAVPQALAVAHLFADRAARVARVSTSRRSTR